MSVLITTTPNVEGRRIARYLGLVTGEANAASRRVAEAAGFTLEGILRKARRDVRGRLEDHCIYAKVFA